MDNHSVEARSIGARPTAVMTSQLAVDEIGDWMSRAFHEISDHLHSSGNHPTGPPFARYRRLDDDRFHVEAGFPVASPIEDFGDIVGSSLPAGTVAVVTHLGPYAEMEHTYETLLSWLSSRELRAAGDPWEVYFSDKEDPPRQWRTDIYQPCERAESSVLSR
jgi:effector-binding domain-containing protein